MDGVMCVFYYNDIYPLQAPHEVKCYRERNMFCGDIFYGDIFYGDILWGDIYPLQAPHEVKFYRERGTFYRDLFSYKNVFGIIVIFFLKSPKLILIVCLFRMKRYYFYF